MLLHVLETLVILISLILFLLIINLPLLLSFKIEKKFGKKTEVMFSLLWYLTIAFCFIYCSIP